MKFSIDQDRLTRYCEAADAASAAVREANANEREARDRLAKKKAELIRLDPRFQDGDSVKLALARIEQEVDALKSASIRATENAVHAKRLAQACIDYARPISRQLLGASL